MTTTTTTASPWPARCAYISACIFTAASGAINIVYGWQKGGDLADSIVWAAVAAAVAVVFAIFWPATIRSVEARRWSAAVVSVLALTLAGSYSVTAALGSASGGRVNAAATKSATTDARAKAQASYDAARAELDNLKASRPVAELEALVAGARPVCRIIVTSSRRDTVCNPPPALTSELGRAKRRVELEAKLDRVSGELAKIQPAKVANSDAKALARYLSALGVDVAPDRLNDLLVLLAVLMIEAGGGLSLALGMALSAMPVSRTPQQASEQADPAMNAATAPMPQPVPKALIMAPVHAERPAPLPIAATVHERPIPAPAVQSTGIVALVQASGGALRTTTRRLGDQLGRPAATVHGELRRLAAEGLITLNADSRGTSIALAAAAKPN